MSFWPQVRCRCATVSPSRRRLGSPERARTCQKVRSWMVEGARQSLPCLVVRLKSSSFGSALSAWRLSARFSSGGVEDRDDDAEDEESCCSSWDWRMVTSSGRDMLILKCVGGGLMNRCARVGGWREKWSEVGEVGEASRRAARVGLGAVLCAEGYIPQIPACGSI